MGCKKSIIVSAGTLITSALITMTYPSIAQAAINYISGATPLTLSSAQKAATTAAIGSGKPESTITVLKSMKTATPGFPDCHTVNLLANGELMTYKVNCR